MKVFESSTLVLTEAIVHQVLATYLITNMFKRPVKVLSVESRESEDGTISYEVKVEEQEIVVTEVPPPVDYPATDPMEILRRNWSGKSSIKNKYLTRDKI